MVEPRLPQRVAGLLALLLFSSLLLQSPAAAAVPSRAAPQVLDWVGNLSPLSGAISSGTPYQISVDLRQLGVTDHYNGDTMYFSCMLHWSQVTTFGQPGWPPPPDTPPPGTPLPDLPMQFAGDYGTDDRYSVTIQPLSGQYEYTASCTDLNDSTETWSERPGGNGQLTVTAPANTVCTTAGIGDNDVYWAPTW